MFLFLILILLLSCAGRLTAAEFMLKRPLVCERGKRTVSGVKQPNESEGQMKNRTTTIHGSGIGSRAGAKARRCYRSWWCNNVTFGSWSGVSKPQAKRPNSPDCIHVPASARGRELSAFPMSVRLRHVLDHGGCRLLGDLHGLRYSELEDRRGCGKRTVQELKTLIRNVQDGVFLQPNPPAALM